MRHFLLHALLVIVPMLAAYWLPRYGLRAILRETPGFKELYDQEESYFGALRMKLQGIKQKIVGGVLVAATAAVELHDQIMPMLAGADVTQLLPQVPTSAWPFITVGVVLLLNWFRKLAENRGDLPQQ